MFLNLDFKNTFTIINFCNFLFFTLFVELSPFPPAFAALLCEIGPSLWTPLWDLCPCVEHLSSLVRLQVFQSKDGVGARRCVNGQETWTQGSFRASLANPHLSGKSNGLRQLICTGKPGD